MHASFPLSVAPRGQAQLVVEGMDDEDARKSDIEISVNDTRIFAGPDPLPNDDLPLNSGTWAAHTFTFDASLLVAGQNTITIRNRSPGSFSLPPFFMLDYADLSFSVP